jgi:hypothetical protein
MNNAGHQPTVIPQGPLMPDLARASQNERSCRRVAGPVTFAALALCASACTESFNAGKTRPHGLLPVDERNPIVMLNDSNYDNWQGEYAVLLANAGGPNLAGIVVGTSPNATDINANVTDWRNLIAAARASGLANLPDPITSIGAPLARPANGDIDTTTPNRSEGALFIVDESSRLSLSYRPLVILSGGRLTDVADAYLVDHTVVERVVVLASVGSVLGAGATLGPPNGEMDPWADTIVMSRFRFIAASSFYDQLTDVPDARLADLPANPFGAWIANKQPGIWNQPKAADQCGVAAIGIPGFVTSVEQVTLAAPTAAGATTGPDLSPDVKSSNLLITGVAGAVATARFWQLLLDPATFTH